MRDSYGQIGGIKGALARRADSIFAALTDNEKKLEECDAFRRLFTRLVTLGDGQDDTRRVIERLTGDKTHNLQGSGKRRALLVASNTYRDSNVPSLMGEEARIRRTAELLHVRGEFESSVLLGEAMSQANVMQELLAAFSLVAGAVVIDIAALLEFPYHSAAAMPAPDKAREWPVPLTKNERDNGRKAMRAALLG